MLKAGLIGFGAIGPAIAGSWATCLGETAELAAVVLRLLAISANARLAPVSTVCAQSTPFDPVRDPLIFDFAFD